MYYTASRNILLKAISSYLFVMLTAFVGELTFENNCCLYLFKVIYFYCTYMYILSLPTHAPGTRVVRMTV